jgi:hypothetical protein
MNRVTKALALLLALSTASPAAFAQDASGALTGVAPKGVKRWEYLYITETQVKLETHLKIGDKIVKYKEGMNFLGSIGWELVAVYTDNLGYSSYYFKRELVAK